MKSKFQEYKLKRKKSEIPKSAQAAMLFWVIGFGTAFSYQFLYTGNSHVIYDINNISNIIRPLSFAVGFTGFAFFIRTGLIQIHKRMRYFAYIFIIFGVYAIVNVLYVYSSDLYERNFSKNQILIGHKSNFTYGNKYIKFNINNQQFSIFRHGMDFSSQLNPNHIKDVKTLLLVIGKNKRILRIESKDNKPLQPTQKSRG